MPAPRLADDHRLEAMIELRSELEEFSFDGLMQLREDLAGHAVLRGSWAGCVISYKSGAPGSCRRDRRGRARNAFTVLWDNGWLADEDVAAAVADELALRSAALVRHCSGSHSRVLTPDIPAAAGA
ncbi:MAG TPA: hypothetical protein VHG09_05810 [Longimicrobiales bacterium]|nr:hypothetical protein [Longimicrobiales bacterium]